ncbi:MAG TPA: hemerythrin domain-containing protein [Gemmatimonadales bacterium]|nr:hemerythrin domain-containing protein [Gemmatimonadales bacterium]
MTDDPLTRFELEHEAALAALARLEAAALALECGEPPGPHLATARAVHGELCTAVRAHNEAEEDALFDLMGEDAPTALFVDEHQLLRRLEADLARAIEADDAAQRVPPVAQEIVALLRGHIQRENEVLFPMARALLGSEGLAVVARRLKTS